MPIDAEFFKLHRSPMNVWVEDAITSEYLKEAWREPRLLFLIAGSSESVRPVVSHAVKNGAHNVFGIVDKDFESSNVTRWANSGVRHFILPMHEIENYMLDAAALSGCDVHNKSRTQAAIEQRMLDCAESHLYWMAACQVIKKIRQACLNGYLERPSSMTLCSEADIFTYISQSSWYQTFPSQSGQVQSTSTLQEWIFDTLESLRQDLANGEWKKTFSGKEILRNVRGFIYEPPESPKVSSAIHDIDLAQSVAAWQFDHRQVHPELDQLLKQLRVKSGIDIVPCDE